jgi:hypothetical protein
MDNRTQFLKKHRKDLLLKFWSDTKNSVYLYKFTYVIKVI